MFAPGREQTHVAAQTGNPGSLLSRYRDLIRARHGSPALDRGGLLLLSSPRGRAPLLAFVRSFGGERVLVVHNLTNTSGTVGPFELEAETTEPLFTDPSVESPTRSGTAWSVTLPGRATGIWRLK